MAAASLIAINTALDIRLTRLRALRGAAAKLDEFSQMSFEQVSELLEEMDARSRQR